MLHKYYLCGLKKSKLIILALKRNSKHTKILVLLAIALSLNSYSVNAQYLYEFGFGGGMSGYTGEVSNNPFSSPGYIVGAFYRSNLNSRFSVRLGMDYGKVGGHTDDVPETFPGAQGICDFNFSTQFVSTEVLLEVNFFPYPFQKKVMNSSNITPFIFLGGGMTTYTVLEGLDPEALGKQSPTMIIPFGVGGRWLLGEHWGVQLQFKAGKLFTDRFDSKDLDNPFEFEEGGIHRDDWLYNTTVMFTYSFGEDIWDCNCPGGYKRKRNR